VYVVRGDTTEERIVTLGDRFDDEIEITSGLTAGDLVAADPKGRLTDGAKVEVR
jgi:multidrug efflux pump subunit AcrA (membrane-fusion protein)